MPSDAMSLASTRDRPLQHMEQPLWRCGERERGRRRSVAQATSGEIEARKCCDAQAARWDPCLAFKWPYCKGNLMMVFRSVRVRLPRMDTAVTFTFLAGLSCAWCVVRPLVHSTSGSGSPAKGRNPKAYGRTNGESGEKGVCGLRTYNTAAPPTLSEAGGVHVQLIAHGSAVALGVFFPSLPRVRCCCCILLVSAPSLLCSFSLFILPYTNALPNLGPQLIESWRPRRRQQQQEAATLRLFASATTTPRALLLQHYRHLHRPAACSCIRPHFGPSMHRRARLWLSY